MVKQADILELGVRLDSSDPLHEREDRDEGAIDDEIIVE